MNYFWVTLRKVGQVSRFHRPAYTAAAAYDLVAAEQDDDAFGITVVPV